MHHLYIAIQTFLQHVRNKNKMRVDRNVFNNKKQIFPVYLLGFELLQFFVE